MEAAMSTVLFYRGYVQDQGGNTFSGGVKELFKRISKDYAVMSFSSREGSDPLFMDILRQNDDYLFGRLGKEKDWRDIGYRDVSTKRYSPSISPAEIGTKILEASTYFLMAYEENIIAFINSQGTPRIGSLLRLAGELLPMYLMTCKPIISYESILALQRKGRALSRIGYSYEIPSIEVLRKIGLSATQILKLQDAEVYEVEITIKGKAKTPIATGKALINDIIQTFSDKSERKDLKKLTFSGKEEGMKSQNYSFDESNMQYKIEISKTKTEGGVKKYLNQEEVIEEIYEQLVLTYQAHAREISELIDE
jgi:hypothetical protein